MYYTYVKYPLGEPQELPQKAPRKNLQYREGFTLLREQQFFEEGRSQSQLKQRTCATINALASTQKG